MASSQIQDVAALADGAPHLSDLSNLEPVDAEFRVHGGDVLCQPPAWIADVGWPSSALRSALRAALWVTTAPAIRWVAGMSGWGPDGVGMVTAMCCCRPVCGLGS